jgi:hypothetical protein
MLKLEIYTFLNVKNLFSTFFVICICTVNLYSQALTELQQRIRNSTVGKQKYHVVFQEIDYLQKDAGYNASVILYVDGTEVLKVNGSTLPNHKAGKTVPKDWEYSVIMPTCKFTDYDASSDNRYYSWKRGKRADGKRDCLRLNYKVPTVDISSARSDVKNYVSGKQPDMDELSRWIFEVFGQDSNLPQYQYATNILVHAGWSGTWRGSAGCLTIDSLNAETFFDSIPNGVTGSLEVIREVDGECR